MSINSALIFGAGFGTRMGEITKTIPKPMVTILNKPLIDYAIDITLDASIQNIINKYISNSDLNNEEFLMAYNLLGAQRNIKIIGIFSRLSLRDKKSNYIDLIPRVWNHLINNLNHEACSDLKQWVNKNVPYPNHIVLQKLVHVI